MKIFQLFRTWVLLAIVLVVVVSVVSAKDYGKEVDIDARFASFIDKSGYEKNAISEDEYKHTDDTVEVTIKDEIRFKQMDRGRFIKGFEGEGIRTSIHAPAEKEYIEELSSLLKYAVGEYDTGFNFDAIVEDMLEREGKVNYIKDIYFNDNIIVNISKNVYSEEETIAIGVAQNFSPSEVGEVMIEAYKKKGFSERLEPTGTINFPDTIAEILKMGKTQAESD